MDPLILQFRNVWLSKWWNSSHLQTEREDIWLKDHKMICHFREKRPNIFCCVVSTKRECAVRQTMCAVMCVKACLASWLRFWAVSHTTNPHLKSCMYLKYFTPHTVNILYSYSLLNNLEQILFHFLFLLVNIAMYLIFCF